MGTFSFGRIRVPLALAGGVVLLLGVLTSLPPGWVALLVFVIALAPYLRLAGPRNRPPVPLAVPVTGRWRALNSPASRVPSHGLHAYGQTFAVDLVYEPAPGTREAGMWWPPVRRPEAFPGFGAEVRAPADGVVIVVHDRERDHWSRTGWLALPFLVVESAVRELSGPGRIPATTSCSTWEAASTRRSGISSAAPLASAPARSCGQARPSPAAGTRAIRASRICICS